MKALAITGGGIRGLALVGALQEGEGQGVFDPMAYGAITGDSFGAFIATLLANNWDGQKIGDFFIETDFKRLLTFFPWSLRKSTLLVKPVSLKGISKLIDPLQLECPPNLFLNTWDCEDNKQVIYCQQKPVWASESSVKTEWVENAFEELGAGTCITRSMALPGLVADSPRWLDGGIGEHPPLSFLPSSTHLLLLNLGFSGLIPRKGETTPRGLVDRGLYAYEVASSTRQAAELKRFQSVQEINPKVYDVSSVDFSLDEIEKAALILRGANNTQAQWRALKT